ncbi:hypothetical protein ATANTOWER_028680 [Ataeniobius toweri]|uniref:Uncharacterized protein n=1 Tax=Ataeniobius toweri TaxID=208326 RepID=A0ABU7B224_9TELE|nr:hypothetical protein [Ataeniobius toweri]
MCRCLLVGLPLESVPTDACVLKAFIPMNKISLSKHVSPGGPPFAVEFTMTGGKGQGFTVYNTLLTSATPMCRCVCVYMSDTHQQPVETMKRHPEPNICMGVSSASWSSCL